jgi:hypothetical protein
MKQVQINIGAVLESFNAKLFELGVIQNVLEEIILSHDFTKGNPTREQIDIKIKERAAEIEKQITEQMSKDIIIAKQNTNLILPK